MATNQRINQSPVFPAPQRKLLAEEIPQFGEVGKAVAAAETQDQAKDAIGVTPNYMVFTPTDGATVSLGATAHDVMAYINPSVALTTLTVQMPTNGGANGQRVLIFATKNIGTITITSSGTVYNPSESLNAGDCIEYVKTATSTWARIS
jgi:hypothetical protein